MAIPSDDQHPAVSAGGRAGPAGHHPGRATLELDLLGAGPTARAKGWQDGSQSLGCPDCAGVRACREACVDSRSEAHSHLGCGHDLGLTPASRHRAGERRRSSETTQIAETSPSVMTNVDRAYLDIGLVRATVPNGELNGPTWRPRMRNAMTIGLMSQRCPGYACRARRRPAATPPPGRPVPRSSFNAVHHYRVGVYPTEGCLGIVQESTGCVHSGKSRPRRSITAPV